MPAPPGARTILNPAPAEAFGRDLLDLVDILALNETELAQLASTDLRDDSDLATVLAAAASLRARGSIVVTLGKKGVAALIDGDRIVIPGHDVTAVDTTGAGDCFIGALAARLSAGASLKDALVFANAAASISVQRHGAAPSMPTPDEVHAILNR